MDTNNEFMNIENETDEKQPFRVTDLRSLNWAMKKYKEQHDEIEEYKSFYNEEKAKLDAWFQKVVKAPQDSMEYFESLIVDYARREREENDKKSLSTPIGKVTSRKSAATIQQGDKAALEEYAIENKIEEALKVTLDWTALKKMLAITDDGKVVNTETGEIVEGAKVKPETVSYKVEVTG